jgi:hypothetical protein
MLTTVSSGCGSPLHKTGRITSVERREVCMMFKNGTSPYCFDPVRADDPINVEVVDCVETLHARESTRVLAAEVIPCEELT